jgi:Zn-dependent M32 family carboxypeptidase
MSANMGAEPNQVWTEITSKYLHIVPHPEWSWWAIRVQLVNLPGYMVNYGLGSVLTADLPARIREQIGPFDTGNRRWCAWVSEQLLKSGEQFETAELLRRFLGRPVSPDALRKELARLRPAAK